MSTNFFKTLFLLLFTSCMQTSEQQKYQIQPTGDIDVQVSMGGQKITDLDKQLIHRIEISSRTLDLLKPEGSNGLRLPFLVKKEVDQRGLVMGLKVFRSKEGPLSLEDLGLQERDLLTAIGTKLLTSAKDFELFVKILRNKRELSMTLERDFQPHKIIYYLSK